MNRSDSHSDQLGGAFANSSDQAVAAKPLDKVMELACVSVHGLLEASADPPARRQAALPNWVCYAATLMQLLCLTVAFCHLKLRNHSS